MLAYICVSVHEVCLIKLLCSQTELKKICLTRIFEDCVHRDSSSDVWWRILCAAAIHACIRTSGLCSKAHSGWFCNSVWTRIQRLWSCVSERLWHHPQVCRRCSESRNKTVLGLGKTTDNCYFLSINPTIKCVVATRSLETSAEPPIRCMIENSVFVFKLLLCIAQTQWFNLFLVDFSNVFRADANRMPLWSRLFLITSSTNITERSPTSSSGKGDIHRNMPSITTSTAASLQNRFAASACARAVTVLVSIVLNWNADELRKRWSSAHLNWNADELRKRWAKRHRPSHVGQLVTCYIGDGCPWGGSLPTCLSVCFCAMWIRGTLWPSTAAGARRSRCIEDVGPAEYHRTRRFRTLLQRHEQNVCCDCCFHARRV